MPRDQLKEVQSVLAPTGANTDPRPNDREDAFAALAGMTGRGANQLMGISGGAMPTVAAAPTDMRFPEKRRDSIARGVAAPARRAQQDGAAGVRQLRQDVVAKQRQDSPWEFLEKVDWKDSREGGVPALSYHESQSYGTIPLISVLSPEQYENYRQMTYRQGVPKHAMPYIHMSQLNERQLAKFEHQRGLRQIETAKKMEADRLAKEAIK